MTPSERLRLSSALARMLAPIWWDYFRREAAEHGPLRDELKAANGERFQRLSSQLTARQRQLRLENDSRIAAAMREFVDANFPAIGDADRRRLEALR